jgi:hypothetical protein
MNDTCATIRRLLSEQIDRTLPADERAALRAHLATCPDCRTFERDLQAGLAGIARLPRVSGSPRVREAVLAGVHPGGRSSWPRGWRDWTGQAVKMAGAIGAFTLVAVILMTVFGGSGTGEPDDRFSGAGSQPSAGPPPCVPGQYELTVETTAHPGNPANSNDPGAVTFTVQAIKSTGGAECRLTTPVSLQLTDENGTPLAIEGNPATDEIDAVLGAGIGSVTFPWLNWCGEESQINLKVETTTSSDSTPAINESVDVTAPCADANWPSLLGMSTIELWLTPVDTDSDTDVSTCSGGSNIVVERDSSADGGLRIWFVIKEEGDCEDKGSSVRLRLEEPSGGLLDIEGNDADLTLQLHPSGDFQWVGLLWTNWCGEPSGIKLEATREGAGMGTYAEETPTCADSSLPSRLTILDVPPPDNPWPKMPSTPPTPGMTSEPPVCDPTMLGLRLLPMPSPELYIAIDGSAGGGSEPQYCMIDADEMTVTITDANGGLLPIDRNGETFANDPQGSGAIVWENWCGEEGPFTITVRVADRPLTLEVANGPECTQDDASSSLWGPSDTRTRGP